MLRVLNARNVCRLVRKRLPVLNWLPHYRPNTAVADLVAGVTVGLTLIPQAIAYASLAGLHPQVRIRKELQTLWLIYNHCIEMLLCEVNRQSYDCCSTQPSVKGCEHSLTE